MDEIQLFHAIKRCKHLINSFGGVYAADNFPKTLLPNTFVIVNASPSWTMGSHWILFANKNGAYIFADPLGEPIESYALIYKRLLQTHESFAQIGTGVPVQYKFSNWCGYYCIYIAHLLLNQSKFYYSLINDHQLFMFLKHLN